MMVFFFVILLIIATVGGIVSLSDSVLRGRRIYQRLRSDAQMSGARAETRVTPAHTNPGVDQYPDRDGSTRITWPFPLPVAA